MSRLFIKSFFLIFAVGCLKSEPKEKHFKTELISKTLYCEIFLVHGGGVFGGDKYAEYLTDSSLFRYFVGEYDDNGNISYEISNNDSTLIRYLNYDDSDGSVNVYKVDSLSHKGLINSELNLWDDISH